MPAQVQPPGMHMVFLPTKEDVRAPEADPKFRGETWQKATEAQARRAQTRLPHAPAVLVLNLCTRLPWVSTEEEGKHLCNHGM